MKNLEWRVIPDFPKYVMSEEGDVLEIATGRKLETSRNQYGEHYHLLGVDHVFAEEKTNLLAMTFPKGEMDYEQELRDSNSTTV